MDICDCGDLEVFGHSGPLQLTGEQLRFVGSELLAVLLHLHAALIMHRDIKPGAPPTTTTTTTTT